MPFVPIENTAAVEIRMSYFNQRCENTLFVENGSAWDGSSLTGLGSNIRDWWEGNYAALVSQQVFLREIVCTDQTTETSAQVTVNGGDLNGVDNGDPLSNNVTWAIAFHTASRGRSFRGRNYIVGLTGNALSDANTVLGAWASNVITAYSGLITGALGAGQTWVVASRFSGIDPDTGRPIPRAAGVVTPITTVAYSDLIVDSQRRRLPGRGL